MRSGLAAFMVALVAFSGAAQAACETPELWFEFCVCNAQWPCPVKSASLEKSSKQELSRKHDETQSAIDDLANRNAMADAIGGAGGRADPLTAPAYDHAGFIAAARTTTFFSSNPSLLSAADSIADALDGSAAGHAQAAFISSQFDPLIPDSRLTGRQLTDAQRELAVDAVSLSARAGADQAAIEKDLAALRSALSESKDLRADWRLNSRVKVLLAQLLERRTVLAAIDTQLFSISADQP